MFGKYIVRDRMTDGVKFVFEGLRVRHQFTKRRQPQGQSQYVKTYVTSRYYRHITPK